MASPSTATSSAASHSHSRDKMNTKHPPSPQAQPPQAQPPHSISTTSTVDTIAFTHFDAFDADMNPSLLEAVPPPPRGSGRFSLHRNRKAAAQGHPFVPYSVDRLQTPSHRVLSTCGIVAITYFIGCGGPLGSEPVIAAAGPLIGLSALVLYPLFVTVPYGVILAELCTAFPEDGGFVVWVLNAFGPFWGFQVGYWSWIGGIFNGALLPGLLLQIFLDYFQLQLPQPALQYLLKAGVAVAISFPTFLGTKSVERACLMLLVMVMVPMLAFSIWGYSIGHDLKDLTEIRRAGANYFDATKKDQVLTGPIDIEWCLLLNTLFWNYDGIAMASVFGGEVANPARVYARAIALTIGATVVTYVVPMPAAIITENPHWTNYERDSYPSIALSIGGKLLEKMVLFSSVCGIIGLFLSGLFCKSFQICGMAENQLLPALLAERSTKFDAPHVSIAMTLCCTLMLLSVDFSYLLPVANAFSCAVQLLIIAAAIRLRLFLPFIPRPTKVPGGVWVMGLFAVLPTIVLAIILYHAVQTMQTAVFIGTLILPGLLYGAFQQMRSNNAENSPVMFAYVQ